jgi:acetoin utilization deacetylase AcuC-like enzyme
LAAAGLCLQAALDLANSRTWRRFVVARPAGHHALPDRAKGFCYLNNVALAAETLARAWAAPVLIVDIDVHHGNGIQRLFRDRADVGYVSVHRYPFFPGTGGGDEIGEGAGRGTTRNVPLAAGAGDDVYAAALEDALEEVGSRLRPVAILVSAGFDAHEADPVGGLAVTRAGFARVTTAIEQASRAFSGGRILSVLEGGYDLDALVESTLVHVERLAGNPGSGP